MTPVSNTGKRAPTMKSVEKEEASVPSPMKKQKLDDEEEELEMSSEPEWDVDSYDEHEYIQNPEDRKDFKDDAAYEEFYKYRKDLIQGKGFVPYRFNGVVAFKNFARANEFIPLCIDKYNKETGNTLEYVSTVKGNVRRGGKFTYYMTILAREVPGDPPVEYQVKFMTYTGGRKPPVPILCRPAPPKSED